MSVAIVICTRNRSDELRACLEAIAASTVAPAQVIVSDDGDGADAVCRAAPLPVTYVSGPRRGLAANRNRALREVSAEYASFLDDDCLLAPDFLAIALGALERAERVHGRGKVIISGSELNRGNVLWAHDQTFLGFQAVPYPPGALLNTICINAALMPRALFDRVPFDERLRYGYEESDIATRAVAAGYAIVACHEARNEHRPSPASREDYHYYEEATRLYATFKRYYWTERRRGRAAAFALIAPAHALAAGVKRRDAVVLSALRLAVGYAFDYRRELLSS